jgi:hypothetical protein
MAKALDVAGQLAAAINAAPALQGADGIAADDYGQGSFNAGVFNLRARSSGYRAALAKVKLSAASGMVVAPSGFANLTESVADLEARNHLYITAGVTNLRGTFALDTRLLADGFHDLTAVAYEGNHVRTQTRISLPIQVQNSSLSANLSLLDLTNGAIVQGTYHVQVTANTNNVSTIRLFSTGGQLGSVTNQSSATFTFSGSALGVGLHPFYALVDTASGRHYRTQPQFVRLSAGP